MAFSPIRVTGIVNTAYDLAKVTDRIQDQLAAQINPALVQLQALKTSMLWTFASLTNGWVNWVNASTEHFSNARYGKDALGFVHVSGLVKGGTVGNALANAILTVPVGFRPKNALIYSCSSNGAFGEVRVNGFGTGEVVCSTGNNGYVSLDGISWLAEV